MYTDKQTKKRVIYIIKQNNTHGWKICQNTCVMSNIPIIKHTAKSL